MSQTFSEFWKRDRNSQDQDQRHDSGAGKNGTKPLIHDVAFLYQV